jgi:O-antigen/teichoic acid export membrane protein
VSIQEEVEPQEEQTSLGGRAASGVLWLTVQKWVVRVAGLVTIAILTRLLSPEAFGTVAAALTVLPFFYLLSDLGFAMYIVQAKRVDQRLLNTGFWFSVGAGVVLAGALVLGAPFLGVLFETDAIVPVIRVLAAAVILTSVASVPMALLKRRMNFSALAIQGVIASVVGQAVAVAMAFSGLGVWALVGQSLGSQVVVTVLSLVSARWWPTLTTSRADFSSMARFGGKVLGVELVSMVRAAGEAAIVSAVLGITTYGYLAIAQRIVQIVQELTGAALLPVTTVAFARLRESAARLQAAYAKALRLTYAVMAPPLVLLAVAAPLIVPLVFGDGWVPSVRVTQFLALAGTVVVGATLDHGLFYGLGQPGRWFVYGLVVDVLTISTTAVVVHAGLVPVAVGFLAVALLATVTRWFLVARLLGTTPLRVASPFLFLVVTVALSGTAGWGVLQLVGGLPPVVGIGLVGLAILLVHLVLIRLMVRVVLTDVGEHLARLSARLPGRGRAA